MPIKKSGLRRNKNSKATPYRNKGVTEVGKEAKTQSYKEYVQKMFGGGMTQTKMNRGGLTLDPMSRKKSFIDSKDSGLRNVGTQAERDLGLRLHKGPGMKAGGKTPWGGAGPKPPSTPGGIDKIRRFRNRNPDPVLPRGKRGKGPGI